ncbi:hypothetical protein [Lactobacillus delbrueckii]|uniref:hypothetical protein n=1 Tax=Lactobacillus delbrueckii TaxID=1584 RepID=UPI001E58FA14|nr:hypothetical protein [Lactobacillus delbrueckii]MCD5519851.1 hypothetical protein [Lactobacillus delbrueckii subsp. lactis]
MKKCRQSLNILLVIASEFSQQLRYIFPVVAFYIQQEIIESAVLNNLNFPYQKEL